MVDLPQKRLYAVFVLKTRRRLMVPPINFRASDNPAPGALPKSQQDRFHKDTEDGNSFKKELIAARKNPQLVKKRTGSATRRKTYDRGHVFNK